MTFHTYTNDIERVHVICEKDVYEWPTRYEIRFEGRRDEVVAEPGDSDEKTWDLVLRAIVNLQWAIRVGGWPGNADAYATVYAGITPTADQERNHQRDHLSSCLYQRAQDPKVPGETRVRAYAALCELHGLAASHQQSLSSLVRAEKARRAKLRTLENSWRTK
jgi:hypothetical protein